MKIEEFLANAWKRITNPLEKLSLIVTSLMLIPYMILKVLPSKLFPSKFKSSAPVAISESVFQVEYHLPGNCQCTILKSGNSLLLHCLPPYTTETNNEIEKLGQVDVLVLASLAHDTHLKSWMAKYPDAIVLGPPLVNGNTVTDTGVYYSLESKEAQAVLKNYGVVQLIRAEGYLFYDNFWMVKSKEVTSSHIIIAPCGRVGKKETPKSMVGKLMALAMTVFGFGAMRMPRFFSLVFADDPARAFVQWNTLMKLPNVHKVLFQHGLPCEPNECAEMWHSRLL